MKNVLAVFGALFIFIWVGLVFFGDSMSEDKAGNVSSAAKARLAQLAKSSDTSIPVDAS